MHLGAMYYTALPVVGLRSVEGVVMRFDVSPAVRCSGVLRCCLTVLVVLWAGFAGLQGVVVVE